MGELLSIPLAAWGIVVPRSPGRIDSRQKCRVCGAVGNYVVRGEGQARWLWCSACGQFPASSFEIVLRWHGTTLRLGYDRRGQRLASYPDAEAALSQIRSELKRGDFEPHYWSSPKHNAYLWENYLATHLERERARLSRTSWRTAKSQAKHLVGAFAGQNIRDLRQGQVDDWVRGPLATSGLSLNYQAQLCRMLAHVFADALHRQDMRQPLKVPRPKVPHEPIQWLGPEEQAAVLTQIPPEHRPIFEFMMLYGVRVGEACALMWDCVDWRREVVIIRRTVSAYQIEERTKTGLERLLPLGPRMRDILSRVPAGIGAAIVFRNPDSYSCNSTGRYNQKYLAKVWARAVEAAGLPPIMLKNGTRHSRGMQLINHVEGATVDDAAALLGHRSTRTTTRFYAHPEIGRLRGLVDPAVNPVVNQLSIVSGGEKDGKVSK